MSFTRQAIFILVSFLFSVNTLATLSPSDRETFRRMQQETLATGSFQLLNSQWLKGTKDFTPFGSRVVEIKQELINQGMEESTAELKALDIFRHELSDKQSSVAKEKSKLRMDFCHNVTGVCVSDEDPSLLGKRPSQAQLPYFFPGSFENDLSQLKTHASLLGPDQPWSDDYWPIRKGILGRRYADKESNQSTWEESLLFVMQQPNHLLSVMQMPEGEEKNKALLQLSPGEKYDLLVGNVNKSELQAWMDWLKNPTYSPSMDLKSMLPGQLNPMNWQQGQYYFDEKGEVESWMGICHGWASASIHMPRPLQSVKAMAFDGKTEITFLPTDIKALGSYLWAQSAPPSRFIGGRCNDEDVELDPDTGAILSDECFDTNPGDWHLVIANYLGEMQQSFIMDATFDYAVWNQPVLSYSMEYFNPADGSLSLDVQDVAILYADFKDQDPLAKFRSSEDKIKFLVGVRMKVQYLAEIPPLDRMTSDTMDDRFMKDYYMYDLELDENYKIIGGEWHQNNHPDFLWSHDPGQFAISRVEKYYAAQLDQLLYQHYPNGKLDFSKALPKGLTQFAEASAEIGEATAFIVEALFEESHN